MSILGIGIVLGLVSMAFPKKFQAVPLLVFLVLLIVFSSIKSDNVGMDTSTYHKMFNDYGTSSWKNVLSPKNDIGFSSLCKIVYSIYPSFLLFNFTIYTLIWSSLAITCYCFSSKPALTFSLVVSFLLTFVLSAYRQALSLSIVSLSCCSVMTFKKSYLKLIMFLLLSLVGVSIHKTAIISLAILAVYIFRKKINLSILQFFVIFIIFLLLVRSVYFVVTDVVDTSYAPYANNDMPWTAFLCICVFVASSVLNFLPLNARLSIARHSKDKSGAPMLFYSTCGALISSHPVNEEKRYLLRCANILTFVGAIAMSFSLSGTVFSRIFYYFVPFICLNISETLINRSSRPVKIVLTIATCGFVIAYFAIALVNSGYYGSYIPYETIF